MAPKTSTAKTPADHVKEGNGFADVTLSRPAKFNDVEKAVVRMREPTVGDIENFNDATGSETSRECASLANLIECSPDDVRALPLRDYARLQAAFQLFTT